MRTGRRIGVDVGKARIGVAGSDPDGIFAHPIETLQRSEGVLTALRRIHARVIEYDAIEVIVGLPLNLQAAETESTRDAREFAHALARELGHPSSTPVRLVDERLSTSTASRAMTRNGTPVKRQRSRIDQIAAVVILQQALDIERTSGAMPGTLVDTDLEAGRDA